MRDRYTSVFAAAGDTVEKEHREATEPSPDLVDRTALSRVERDRRRDRKGRRGRPSPACRDGLHPSFASRTRRLWRQSSPPRRVRRRRGPRAPPRATRECAPELARLSAHRARRRVRPRRAASVRGARTREPATSKRQGQGADQHLARRMGESNPQPSAGMQCWREGATAPDRSRRKSAADAPPTPWPRCSTRPRRPMRTPRPKGTRTRIPGARGTRSAPTGDR